jgi:hypothetical protein
MNEKRTLTGKAGNVVPYLSRLQTGDVKDGQITFTGDSVDRKKYCDVLKYIALDQVTTVRLDYDGVGNWYSTDFSKRVEISIESENGECFVTREMWIKKLCEYMSGIISYPLLKENPSYMENLFRHGLDFKFLCSEKKPTCTTVDLGKSPIYGIEFSLPDPEYNEGYIRFCGARREDSVSEQETVKGIFKCMHSICGLSERIHTAYILGIKNAAGLNVFECEDFDSLMESLKGTDTGVDSNEKTEQAFGNYLKGAAKVDRLVESYGLRYVNRGNIFTIAGEHENVSFEFQNRIQDESLQNWIINSINEMD